MLELPDHNILDFYAQTHTAYLHARGIIATRQLAALLDGRPGEKILEIGFGTGSTTVFMATAFPQTRFFGVEISPIMLRKARARLRFCGLEKQCTLYPVNSGDKLPFTDQYFDKIYIESVLGILENAYLTNAIHEIHRLLKPGGKMVINETIWLDSTLPLEIDQINRNCLEKFGIIQANDHYLKDWITLFEKNGIHIEKVIRLAETGENSGLHPRGRALLLSRLYTFWGRLKTKLHPRYRKTQAQYDQKGLEFTSGKKYMEGVLMLGVRR